MCVGVGVDAGRVGGQERTAPPSGIPRPGFPVGPRRYDAQTLPSSGTVPSSR
jgi:hypothetical protein